VSSGNAINAGFFQNVGKTRRQGVELTGATQWGPLGVVARYGYIDATFVSGFTEHSPANSSADANGDIVVAGGNRIPGIPQHTLRVRLDFTASEALAFGANLVANGAIRSRGDENNQDVHGTVPGYALVNVDGVWRFAKNWELFGRIDNVFNRDVANFGTLGRNVFANPSRTFDPANAVAEPFLGLAPPRGAWIGLRYAWK
jgi:outer membrane receptor protein involved in Fe transport